MVFGVTGIGKTQFGSTCQDDTRTAPLLIIDADAGTRTIMHRDDIAVFRAHNLDDVREAYVQLATGDHVYRSVMLDTFNSIYRMALEAACSESRSNPDVAGLQEYGKANETVARMVKRYRDLSTEQGITFILTCHVADLPDPISGDRLFRPSMTPGAYKEIPTMLDFVGYLGMTDTGERFLQLKPTSRIAAKYRVPSVVSDQVPDRIMDPTMTNFLDAVSLRPRAT